MNAITIALKNIKQNLKRPVSLVLLTLFPLVMILILGQALSGVYAAGPMDLELRLAYAAGEETVFSAALGNFLQNPEGLTVVLTSCADTEEGIRDVAAGRYHALLVMHEQTRELELVTNNNHKMEAGILEGLILAYVNSYNFGEQLNFYLKASSVAQPEALLEMLDLTATSVSLTTLSAPGKPRAIDYFGIILLTMVILWGSYVGAYGIIDERHRKTLDRIQVAPVTRLQIFGGIFLGALFSLIIQMVALFLAARYLLAVNYGSNLFYPLVILLGECFFALCFGIGIALRVKNDKAANGIINTLVPLLIFLGGGYVQLPDTQVFKILEKLSPLSWINKALFEMIYAGTRDYFLPAFAITLGSGLVILILAGSKTLWRKSV